MAFITFSYGHWGAVHKPFKYWAIKGYFIQSPHHVQVDPDVEYTMIDGTPLGRMLALLAISKMVMIKKLWGEAKED